MFPSKSRMFESVTQLSVRHKSALRPQLKPPYFLSQLFLGVMDFDYNQHVNGCCKPTFIPNEPRNSSIVKSLCIHGPIWILHSKDTFSDKEAAHFGIILSFLVGCCLNWGCWNTHMTASPASESNKSAHAHLQLCSSHDIETKLSTFIRLETWNINLGESQCSPPVSLAR